MSFIGVLADELSRRQVELGMMRSSSHLVWEVEKKGHVESQVYKIKKSYKSHIPYMRSVSIYLYLHH